jgi:hypothetical protein
MIAGVHVEVILAASYTLFLVAAAFVLEFVARHSHRRSERYRNSGFVFFRELDYWQCPAGQQLLRDATDYKHRIVHYRAPAVACNACSLKNNCTDSNEGRLLLSHSDSWIESEVRQFHRGISLSLLILATMILVVTAIRHGEPLEILIICSFLLPIGLAAIKLLSSFSQVSARTDSSNNCVKSSSP